MPDLHIPWTLHFDRDGTEDYGTIRDADGKDIVSTQNCQTCWLPESPDDYLEMPDLVYQLRLMSVAPKLLDALRIVVEMEYDRDEESRNFDAERLEFFASLIAEAEWREP
ncbi:MAG: hypothetical protein K8U57_37010 [Planctomycetes bacterium]|nr:hypothetical protein [Planctomycetota bacterium]